MIAFIAVIHLAWAIMLWASPSAAFVTVHGDVSEWIGGRHVLASLLFIASVTAMIGLRKRTPGWFAVQQASLFLSSVAAILAIGESAFGDGVMRPRLFIAADQLWIIAACVMHLWEMLRVSRGKGCLAHGCTISRAGRRAP